MGNLWNLWGREPAMVLALVQTGIVLAVSFGLRLTPEQTGAILAMTAVVLGLITRSQVSSPQTVTAKTGAAYGAGQADAIEHAAVLATFDQSRASAS